MPVTCQLDTQKGVLVGCAIRAFRHELSPTTHTTMRATPAACSQLISLPYFTDINCAGEAGMRTIQQQQSQRTRPHMYTYTRRFFFPGVETAPGDTTPPVPIYKNPRENYSRPSAIKLYLQPPPQPRLISIRTAGLFHFPLLPHIRLFLLF